MNLDENWIEDFFMVMIDAYTYGCSIYDPKKIPFALKEQFAQLEAKQLIMRMLGDWSTIDPPSGLGPPWWMMFNASLAFGKIKVPPKRYPQVFASRYIKIAQKEEFQDVFSFSTEQFQRVVGNIGASQFSSLIFDVGVDPFTLWYGRQGAEDVAGKVRTKEQDWQARHTLITHPSVNWLISPRPRR
jgi:hypothetical protein